MNDNIYQSGNIYKDPYIDVFKIFSIRKRKRRSHGIHKNDNILRKLRQKLSISDLHNIRLTSDKHAMLSRLSSSSISSLKDIDEQADKIDLRTDPLVGTVCLIQSYTQNVLKPHIDKRIRTSEVLLKIILL